MSSSSINSITRTIQDLNRNGSIIINPDQRDKSIRVINSQGEILDDHADKSIRVIDTQGEILDDRDKSIRLINTQGTLPSTINVTEFSNETRTNDTTLTSTFSVFKRYHVAEILISVGCLAIAVPIVIIVTIVVKKIKARRERLDQLRNRHSFLWRASSLSVDDYENGTISTRDNTVRSSRHSSILNMYGYEDAESDVYEYLSPLPTMVIQNPSELNHYDPVSPSTFF